MFGSSKKQTRLDQWDGRRRSSRSDSLIPMVLWSREVLIRLAVVFATALGVTSMVFFAGPPLAYRPGEVHPHEIRSRVDFEVINVIKSSLIRHEWLMANREKTPEEMGPTPPLVMEMFPNGGIMVEPRQVINEDKFQMLRSEHRAYVKRLTWPERVTRLVAIFLIILLLTCLLTVYTVRFQMPLAASLSKIVSLCVLVMATVGAALLLSPAPWYAMLVPLTFAAMVLTIVYNPPFALLMSFSIALVMNVGVPNGLPRFLIHMGGLGTAVLLLREMRTRTRPVEVGLIAGIAYVMMTVATEMLLLQPSKLIINDAVRYFIWALLSGFILSGCLPLIERVFGIVTDVSLLELADNTHPLMQELVRRAPGTYTHSMTVALLAEAAADAIGAHALLVRVGCYYHDIGKMLKPHYFIENQNGENRHDRLEPALSTLVIIGHVKDGMALARQYNLPKPIQDFIQQHHGTTLVEYFYREAMRIQEESGFGSNSELEFSFRYPGPKPQSREAGILMLADCVESASRAMSSPTPSSIRKLVHDLLMKRLLDGQFEESELTLTELKLIEQSLCKSVIAVYHARIKYPSDTPLPKRNAS